MKRPFIIIISVVVVFLLIGTAITASFGGSGVVKEQFSNTNRSLGFGGGGGGASDAVGMAPAATAAPAPEAPVPQEAFGSTTSNIAPAAQERLVIQNADLAIVVK